jgi:hypothetical protein
MGFKDILVGVNLATFGAIFLLFAIALLMLNFGNYIIIIIGGVLFIFGIALMFYGRNKTRGYR